MPGWMRNSSRQVVVLEVLPWLLGVVMAASCFVADQGVEQLVEVMQVFSRVWRWSSLLVSAYMSSTSRRQPINEVASVPAASGLSRGKWTGEETGWVGDDLFIGVSLVLVRSTTPGILTDKGWQP
jgi:hypothetical protein